MKSAIPSLPPLSGRVGLRMWTRAIRALGKQAVIPPALEVARRLVPIYAAGALASGNQSGRYTDPSVGKARLEEALEAVVSWCRDPEVVEPVVAAQQDIVELAGGITPRHAQDAVQAIARLLAAIVAKKSFEGDIVGLLLSATLQ